jgi:hypothetical protein
MTKRDYIKIAKALRDAKPEQFTAFTGDALSDASQELRNYGQRMQWARDVHFICNMLDEDNPDFISDLFLTAAGDVIRPDGAMYVMDWDRGVVAR